MRDPADNAELTLLGYGGAMSVETTSDQVIDGQADEPVEETLRKELAQGDVILATTRPILRHLLANDDHALFSDEVVARIRSMARDIARQMLHVVAQEAHVDGHAEFVADYENAIAAELLAETDLLAHAHALTFEAQLTDRLHERSGFDPVLSPLLQEHAAGPDQGLAADAMHLLASQARFMQRYRRMELPLTELPGELFDRVLSVMRASCDLPDYAIDAAEQILRQGYDEGARRESRMTRLVMAMTRKANRALSIDHAGLALFITALAMATDQQRDLAVLSLSENQMARLALALRAAGLKPDALEEQLLSLHPAAQVPEGFDTITAQQARAMLGDAAPVTAG